MECGASRRGIQHGGRGPGASGLRGSPGGILGRLGLGMIFWEFGEFVSFCCSRERGLRGGFGDCFGKNLHWPFINASKKLTICFGIKQNIKKHPGVETYNN